MNWSQLFPFLNWRRPTMVSLRQDLWAGLTVGLVLIPQAIAYATLAGMPPVTGLYAGLLPSVVAILWGSSPVLATGPVALTSLLTFAALQPLAEPGSGEWVTLAIWLALYSGLLQLLIGILRLGTIANFISSPVIAGFVNAAALVITFTQLPALLGLPAAALSQGGAALAGFAPAAAVFGLGALTLLLLQGRFAPRLPGMPIICAIGIALSAALGFAADGGAVVGAVPAGLPTPVWFPALGLEQHRALLPAAVIIALISFTEAMSSSRTLARQRGERWEQNQELVGQGAAKIISGVSGAFPVSGSFSRSALNAYAGARSGWSALIAAACMCACLLWFTGVLFHLPRAVLAAIITVAMLRLIDFGAFRRLWRVSRRDALVALVTFAVTLLAVPNSHWGVLAGFTLSMFFYLYSGAHPRIIEVGLDPSGSLRDRAAHHVEPIAPGVLAVRIDAGISYITAPVLERFISDRVANADGLDVVLLCASGANDIDTTGVEALRQLHRNLRAQGIALMFSGVKKQVRDVLHRAHFVEDVGEGDFFANNREAIARLRPDIL